MAVSGLTRVFTILAHPSTHVTAPIIYNHIFSCMNLDMVYISHDVRPQAVVDTVKSFSGWINLGGFNVTIPHKGSVASVVDNLCEISKKTGVVNTVVRHDDGTLSGYNTDGIGALGAIGEVQGAVCLVVGAGGAARAIIHALLGAGARKVLVMNRSLSGAMSLCDIFIESPVHVYQAESLEEMDILIQATPEAVKIPLDLEVERLRKGTRVLETIMRPTTLSEKAHSLGMEVIPGHAMLYHQTMKNFELLTGIPVPERHLDNAFAYVGYHRP